MAARGTPLQAHLRALPEVLWALFLVFTAVGFIVMPFNIGEVTVREWIRHKDLAEAAVSLLNAADAIWMLLAAMNVYLWLIRAEGLSTARRWGAIIVFSTAILEWVGAVADFPFGPYDYTDRMGLRLAEVLPFTIPLAWFVIVITGRYTVLHFFPKASRVQLALGTGLIALLTDINMEFVAWKVRAYWIWYPGNLNPPSWPPLQNYISWFVSAAVLCFLLREQNVAGPRRNEWRPILVLALINALFLAIHVARWLA